MGVAPGGNRIGRRGGVGISTSGAGGAGGGGADSPPRFLRINARNASRVGGRWPVVGIGMVGVATVGIGMLGGGGGALTPARYAGGVATAPIVGMGDRGIGGEGGRLSALLSSVSPVDNNADNLGGYPPIL